MKDYKGEDDFDPRFTHDMIGYNFKTTDLSAALGISQLRRIDQINQRRAEIVKYLNKGLKRFSELLQLPDYSMNVSYLAYPIIIRRPDIVTRKCLRLKLEEYGIETRPLFGCIPTQQPAYANLKKEYKDKLPNAEYAGRNGFYIGCHQYLQNDDLDYVADIFEKILKGI
jgi:CDP-6-deoxy-D-xylo-4-hexulose-3-dehydrase